MEDSITLGELLLLLAVYGGPVYLAGGLLAWVSLPRATRQAGRPATRAAGLLLVAALAALPLTLGVWGLTGYLPARLTRWIPTPDVLGGFGGYVVPPALVATLLALGPTVWYLRRRARAAT